MAGRSSTLLNPGSKPRLEKFHRVLSLTLLFLAALILIAEMFRHPTLPEVLLPGSVLALVLTRGLRLARELPARQNSDGSESVRVVFGSRRLSPKRNGAVEIL